MESCLGVALRSGGLVVPEDYFEAFLENKELATPRELTQLLEEVWPAALEQAREKVESGELAASAVAGSKARQRSFLERWENEGYSPGIVVQAQKLLFNTNGFMQVLKDVVWKMDLFGEGELPRLLNSFHAMMWSDRELFRLAQGQVINHLPSLPPADVSDLVVSYVEVQCGGRVLFEEFSRRSLQALPQLSTSDLVKLASAFSRAPHKPKAFLMEVGPEIFPHLNNGLPAAELTALAEAYSRWPRHIPAAFIFGMADALIEDEGRLAGEMTGAQLITVLRTMLLWKSRSTDKPADPAQQHHHKSKMQSIAKVFQLSVPVLLRECEELTPADSATALWAFAKVGVVPETLFSKLYDNVVEGAESLETPALAAALLVSARGIVGHLPVQRANADGAADAQNTHQDPAKPVICDWRLLDACEERVQASVQDFDTRDLTSVILAYSLAHAGSLELFAVLHKSCLDRCRLFTMEQVATLGWCFATIRLGSSFFKEAQFDVLDKLSQLTIPAICDLLWSFCAARHRDPHFFKALLSVLVPSRVANEPRCALLCPALLDIRSSLPDMDPEGVDRYLNYTRGIFHQTQLANLPSPEAMQSIEEVLKALGATYESVVDFDGYALDFLVRSLPEEDPLDSQEASFEAASALDSMPVALLHHTAPQTLHRRTGEPLGSALMRQRHLTNMGLGVVNLWGQAWSEMDFRERVPFLEQRLRDALSASSSKPTSSSSG